MSLHGMKLKTALFWNLLFLDAFVLHFRYGGMSVRDLIFHGVCLGLGTLLLALHKRTYPVPKIFIALFGCSLGMVLLQLMPMPQFLFPVLAPIKHRVLTAITSIYPEIMYTTQIAILPDVVPIRLITLLFDMYLVLLMIMAPKPGIVLYRFWLVTLSLATASLAVVTSWETTHASGLMLIYKGTYGGLVNPNNFAALANIFMVLLLGQVVVSARDAWTWFRNPNTRDSKLFLKKVIFCLFYAFCYLHTFYGFQSVKSRSGVLGFILVHVLMGLFLLKESGHSQKGFFLKRRLTTAVLFLAFIVGAVSMAPLEKEAVTLEEQSLQHASLISYQKIGWDYLREFPILGAGLGASECILEAVQPKVDHAAGNARHFHNEYLQYAVELGLPGLVGLFLFMVLVARGLIPGFSQPSFEKRVYFYGLSSSLIFLSLLCVVSFPLRITSIRVLVLLLTFIAMKLTIRQKKEIRPLPLIAMVSMILVACLAWLIPAALYQPKEGADLESVKRTIRYGRPYKEYFFVANQKLADFFEKAGYGEAGREELVEIQRDIYKSLEHQQFNIKALNILFITEALLDKLDHPQYDEQRYQQLRHKALVINDLGKGANLNSQSALLFIFGMYEEQLNAEDRQAYDILKDAYAATLEEAEARLKENEQKTLPN